MGEVAPLPGSVWVTSIYLPKNLPKTGPVRPVGLA